LQLLLCGAQTVTLTDGIFGTVEPPAPALIVATLGAVAGAPERVEFDVFVTEGAAPPAADTHGRRMCADAWRHRRRDRSRIRRAASRAVLRWWRRINMMIRRATQKK
jgi:hypothetical protein